MTIATMPELAGFETYYGLRLSDIGEDGNVIILGHHSDDPMRVVAALNQHARTFWGMTNLMDAHGAVVRELADMIAETWAVARCGEHCHDLTCAGCEQVRAGTREWWIDWLVAEDESHAFPVTVWRP